MTTWELIALAVGILPVIYRAWQGWKFGATVEMRHVIVVLFAILVTIRYWQVATELVERALTMDARLLLLAVFAFVYTAATALAAFAVGLRSEMYRSVQSDPINSIAGVLAGVVSGSLLGGTLAMLLNIASPGKFDPAPSPLVGEVIRWPVTVYRFVETDIAGVAADSPDRTKMPAIELVEEPVPADAPEAEKAPEGTTLMRLRPTVVWN